MDDSREPRRTPETPAGRSSRASGPVAAEHPLDHRAGGWVWGRVLLQAVAAVGRHPSLWGVALRQTLRLAQPGWWRHRPFLPLPPLDYLRFRLQTAYGGEGDRASTANDLVTYLRWCRDMHRWRTGRMGARWGGDELGKSDRTTGRASSLCGQ